MMVRLVILISFMFLPFSYANSKVKMEKCGGTYPYYYSESISHAEAKAKAVENAIIMALADKYGTTVTSQSLLELTNNGDRFNQVSRLHVKGKLVKHLHEPKISAPVFADNLFKIDVTVNFFATAIEYAPTEFVAKVLRNGQEDKFESDVFANGDKFYMSILSPKEGYVAIFFEDKETVNCMLPYMDEDEPFHVSKGEKYVFFNKANNTYHVVCGEEAEINYIHILFSSRKFIDGDIVREMQPAKFRGWLGVRQSYDENLQIQSIMIKINPDKQ